MLECEKSLLLGTQGASIYYNIACLYSLKKDVVNAIKSLRKAMELD
ncbi:MAG: tetratricopeptide repeat protein, partial [Candidatus Omnitrophica bacterium]|nr:tetratricopeptide repeat protein [Candidatus Omnitrophota bacterium]MBU1924183.1 tetratricopeptide repeat protein [Candidatus Omnitrophota bacterium]